MVQTGRAQGIRVSTARRPSPHKVVDLLFEQLPPGVVLNLGAGFSGHARSSGTVVNVDHASPPVPGAGEFVIADAGALPFPKAVFEGILMKDVLEHVPDAIAVLSEARRVAAPGARLIVTTPRAIARAVWDDPTHVRGFTARALVSALEMSGWHPLRAPRRLGGLPGAGRLRLEPYLEQVMRVPALGHWFGTNWIVRAVTG